jgi:hypothetical protein
MMRTRRQRLQDEKVERALNQGGLAKHTLALIECLYFVPQSHIDRE